MKTWLPAWASIGVVAVVAAFFFFTYHSPAPPPVASGETEMRSVTIGDREVYVTIADTEAAREHGLSGRQSLAPDEGMLFIFPSDGKPSFWMKDMRFSIDILWLTSEGKVVYIMPNLSPETYPTSYAPPVASRYVLELPAGTVAKYNVHLGDIVEL